MATVTVWRVQTEGGPHTVTYGLNRLTGCMTVTLDGDPFTLSAGPLALNAARREPFRIVSPDGEAEQAVLIVDKRGRATLLFRGEAVPSENEAHGVVVEFGGGCHRDPSKQ